MLAIKHPEWNKEYNISGNQEKNIYELAKFIINETNSESKIIMKNAEKAQPQKVHSDISEIQKLGYNPKVSFEGGVKRNIKTYKELLNDGKLD